jgi:nucleotidyltransferase substrate binding protein (TIGR01987 family)
MSRQERFSQALDLFERSLARLEEAVAMPESEIVRDAIIKRFEFTFETGWKAMYRWLLARQVDVNEAAFEVIPQAFKLRVIVDEAGWGRMRRMRNLTSHTYDEKLAIEVVGFARREAPALFRALAARLQERPAP